MHSSIVRGNYLKCKNIRSMQDLIVSMPKFEEKINPIFGYEEEQSTLKSEPINRTSSTHSRLSPESHRRSAGASAELKSDWIRNFPNQTGLEMRFCDFCSDIRSTSSARFVNFHVRFHFRLKFSVKDSDAR